MGRAIGLEIKKCLVWKEKKDSELKKNEVKVEETKDKDVKDDKDDAEKEEDEKKKMEVDEKIDEPTAGGSSSSSS